MEKKKRKRMSQESRISWIIVLFELLLFMIPVAVLGYVLVQATSGQKTPVVGNRFVGDLNPKINNSALKSLNSDISSIVNVDNCEINLFTATLRITIDAKDDSSKEQLLTILEEAYKTVDTSLPIDTYFTNSASKRMYDLEIKVHNVNGRTNESEIEWLCVEKVKNGTAEEAIINWVSEPVDADLAKSLQEQD